MDTEIKQEETARAIQNIGKNSKKNIKNGSLRANIKMRSEESSKAQRERRMESPWEK